MRYHELRLRALPHPVVGHQAREFFAAHGDGVLPEALFHYSGGRTIPDAQAPIRFLGKPGNSRRGTHDIVVIGVGDQGADLLYPNARRLAEIVLARYPEWTPIMDMREGEWTAEFKPYPIQHRIRSMAVKMPSKEMESDPEFVASRLADAMNREFEEMGVDQCLSADQMTGLKIIRSFGLRVKSTYFLTGIDVDFSMPYRLGGPWQIGSLKARGYGRLTSLFADKGLR